jgi:hypothetical protein
MLSTDHAERNEKTRLSSRVFQQSQFFFEQINALFWSLQLNRLAASDSWSFWNTRNWWLPGTIASPVPSQGGQDPAPKLQPCCSVREKKPGERFVFRPAIFEVLSN